MRLTILLCARRNRAIRPHQVPLQAPRLPLRLSPKLPPTKETTAYPLYQETQNLITALRENEFTGRFCDKEFDALHRANITYYAQEAQKKKLRLSNKVMTDGKLTDFGKSALLKKYTVRRPNTMERPLDYWARKY